jgi:hypothetical protein
MPDNRLTCGTYLLEVKCVECGAGVDMLITLFGRTTIDPTGGTIRPVLSAKPVDHMCGQLRLHTAAGELVPDDDQPELDYRERAAGADAR